MTKSKSCATKKFQGRKKVIKEKRKKSNIEIRKNAIRLAIGLGIFAIWMIISESSMNAQKELFLLL